MFCPECGKEIPDDSVFCPECGARIDEESESGKAGDAPVVMKPKTTPTPPDIPTPAINQQNEKASASKNNTILYISVLGAAVVLIVAGFFLYKNFTGKGAKPEAEEIAKVENTDNNATTQETPKEDEAKAGDEAKAEAELLNDQNEKEKADAAASDTSKDNDASAAERSIGETFDEDYPNGFSEETALTESDLKAFADRLSTTESAKALDFEWFIDYVNNGGTGPGKFLTDENQVFLVTGSMTPILNGGWKCFMFTKKGDYGSDVERYCNAEIQIEGEKIYITINYDEYFDPSSGKSEKEDMQAKYKGTINTVTGKVVAQSDDSKIEIDNFYSAMDIESEYAVGRFYWISGEIDQFGLMREYFPR